MVLTLRQVAEINNLNLFFLSITLCIIGMGYISFKYGAKYSPFTNA
jgi:hypothetical protein